MAITTISGVKLGISQVSDWWKVGGTQEAASQLHSFWYSTGKPTAASANSAGVAGAALYNPTAGQWDFFNDTGSNTYLANMKYCASVGSMLILCDRLWHNSGVSVTATTGWTINSVAWPDRCPARYSPGTFNTSGFGVMFGIEISTATTNVGAITTNTITYTNSDGTGSRTGTMANFPSSAVAGTIVPFELQAGDVGIKSVETFTRDTSFGAGAIHLVAFRPLAFLPAVATNIPNAVDGISIGFPLIATGTVPFLINLAISTTSVSVGGTIVYANG